MAYLDVAKEILKTNIKAATFIDENAQEFTQNPNTLTNAREEEMSHLLYSKFRESGVSLEPIKYTLGKEKDSNWIEYCLDNRDLILLDWHLDGENGEIQSLKILDNVINRPNIHFCVIYTSEENLDEVFKTILTNYSNLTPDLFTENKEYSENHFGENFDYSEFHKINLGRNNPEIKRDIWPLYKRYKVEIDGFKHDASISDNKCAIIKISTLNLKKNAFFEDLNHPLTCPNYIDNKKHLIEINNTIIAIFNKDIVNPESLLEIFYDHIINDIDSYNHLLAIDFFNRVFRLEILNKDNNMNFNKVALLEHRDKLKKDGLDSLYEEFINELLFEKMNLSLRNSKSKLLTDEICTELYQENKISKAEDKQNMNVFYNSFVLNKNNVTINFGDVFKIKVDNIDKYLICLSSLCDCLRPQKKIKSNYFFAEGTSIKLITALELGDTAFISYLPDGNVVSWTDVPDDESKYVPIYIKPVQYKVLEGKDRISNEGEIELYYINKNGETKYKNAKYITTIRQNYTQRIANHAFSYPLRVGVDFVKL